MPGLRTLCHGDVKGTTRGFKLQALASEVCQLFKWLQKLNRLSASDSINDVNRARAATESITASSLHATRMATLEAKTKQFC